MNQKIPVNIRHELVWVTPEIAEEMLTHNASNRRISPISVSKYAEVMKKGNWVLNGESISFYEDGSLANGQHRLAAVIKANVPVLMDIVYGIPKSAAIFDRGHLRSQSDVLKLNGASTSVANNSVVATINMLFRLSSYTINDSILIDFVSDNEELLLKTKRIVTTGSNKSICNKSPVSAAVFCALYCGVPEDLLSRFFTAANTGFMEMPLDRNAIILRNYLLTEYNRSGAFSVFKKAYSVTSSAIRDYSQGKQRTQRYSDNSPMVYFQYVKGSLIDNYVVGEKNAED